MFCFGWRPVLAVIKISWGGFVPPDPPDCCSRWEKVGVAATALSPPLSTKTSDLERMRGLSGAVRSSAMGYLKMDFDRRQLLPLILWLRLCNFGYFKFHCRFFLLFCGRCGDFVGRGHFALVDCGSGCGKLIWAYLTFRLFSIVFGCFWSFFGFCGIPQPIMLPMLSVSQRFSNANMEVASTISAERRRIQVLVRCSQNKMWEWSEMGAGREPHNSLYSKLIHQRW